jgi:hypothetical protein
MVASRAMGVVERATCDELECSFVRVLQTHDLSAATLRAEVHRE